MSSATPAPVPEPLWAQRILRQQLDLNQLLLGQAIYVAATLGLADLLAGGPCSSTELAERTHTDERSLRRLLRALAAGGVFQELADGRFALNPVANLLRSTVPDSQRANAITYGEVWYRLYGELLRNVTTGESAFEHVFGQPLYAYMAQHPELAAGWDATMSEGARDMAPALLAAYDFSGIGTLVDVGGGQGQLLAAILRAYPALQGVLLDQPQVVVDAPPILAAAGVGERCLVVAGDMFTGVPVGDAYVLQRVVFNWDDEPALTLLRNCRRAGTPGGKVVIIEPILSGPQIMDLHLPLVCGRATRTEEELRALLTAAGFRTTTVLRPKATFPILEAVATD